MAILTTILYFIITIFIIVLIHEFGHFAAAKLSKMRVDRFSIGFPPRAFGKQIGETDYCFSWLPIGGYVKIAGMIDESLDTDYLKNEPQPWEFRSKPMHKKIFVLSAGVLMNLLLSLLIFWGIAFFQSQIIWKTTDIGPIIQGGVAQKLGFLENDKIISVNGKPIDSWNQLEGTIFLEQMSDNADVKVERAGQTTDIIVPKNTLKESDNFIFLNPKYVKVSIMDVESGSLAEKAGIQKNDIFAKINGTPVLTSNDVINLIQSNAGNEVSIEMSRDNKTVLASVTPDKTSKRIGIRLTTNYFGPKEEIRLGFFNSFLASINTAYTTTYLFIKSIWQIITGKIEFSSAVGGPVKIAKYASQSAELGIVAFLSFIAMLSLTLAIINILPFPALDGGHLVFVIIEGIMKKEIPPKVKIIIQQIGFSILMIFMVFVIYNDIVR
jgi:regulator of sigma E protease